MTTQCYNAPSGEVRKRFVVILYVELEGFRTRKWNAEKVAVFQSVILQHTQGVNNYKHISVPKLFQIY